MLNISEKYKVDRKTLGEFSTLKMIEHRPHYRILNRIIVAASVVAVLMLFLPWNQTISGSGAVTTLKPGQRPQTIHTAIAGRIEKWYVSEGDFVRKGDTILFISEIKEDYFDPNLVENTERQMNSKKRSAESYENKIGALQSQALVLRQEKQLKLQQAKNKIRMAGLKVKSDSVDLEAYKTQLKIASTQFDRSVQLNREGLKPMTDVEDKRLKLQEAQAKVLTQDNKLLAARNELINSKVEISRIDAEYDEKILKAESDRYTAMSNQFDTEAQVAKLENQYVNYEIRSGLYVIRAPQDGYVNRAMQSGVGETVKEGTPIVSIMPANYDIAVETYVNPVDLPLLQKGGKIRVWFDGWPTIVFSGWPDMSYGTFGGKVVAIENFISPNGKYRVLVAPDADEDPWPKQLTVGAGAQTMALLDTVPIWYEIWRTLNGFPPDFYNLKKPEDGKVEK